MVILRSTITMFAPGAITYQEILDINMSCSASGADRGFNSWGNTGAPSAPSQVCGQSIACVPPTPCGPRHHVVDSPILCSCTRSAYSRVKQHIHSRVVTFVQKAGPNSGGSFVLIFIFDRIGRWVSFRASITPTYENF